MSESPHLSKKRASLTPEFKLELVEKSYQPGVCVAHPARQYGINDNLLSTWRQRYRHLLPDDVQRLIPDTTSVISVVVSDMPLSYRAEPACETVVPTLGDGLTCDVSVGGANLRLTGNLSPTILKALIRKLRGPACIPASAAGPASARQPIRHDASTDSAFCFRLPPTLLM